MPISSILVSIESYYQYKGAETVSEVTCLHYECAGLNMANHYFTMLLLWPKISPRASALMTEFE